MARVAFWVVSFFCVCVACSGNDHDGRVMAADGGEADDDAGDAEDADGIDPEEEDGEAAEADGGLSQDAAGRGGLCSTCGGCEETRTGLSAQHKPEPIAYSDNPPMGGDHAACWTTFGVHISAEPESRWVHNMEHGAVVFLYNCASGCAADIKEIEAIAKGRPFALVTPNARIPKRFAVVAWGARLLTDCLDRGAFERFYEQHVDRAGESSTSAPPGGC
jgi:hypothetical protein